MQITIKWFGDQFNVSLANKAGEDFLSIKGCRIKAHNGKQFIGFPARKTDEGKWWNHVWASDAFQAAVIEKAQASQPARQQNASAPVGADDMDDIPFGPVLGLL